MDCVIKHADAFDFLSEQKSVDLILTDPPYSISIPGGERFPIGPKSLPQYNMRTDFGEWDHKDVDLHTLCVRMFIALRKGGSAIVFYDLWKMNYLASAMQDAGFVQLRMIEWIKTNPVPINANATYLSNGREVAVFGVKGGKSTFNSYYDVGIYKYPIPQKPRYHPTQKPLDLFKVLVKKHSNEGDLIVDPYLGSGTTALASISQNRKFHGCDISQEFVDIVKDRVSENMSIGD